jgi:hypothetical protein
LNETCPASDLVEGILNNVDRPPVKSRDGSRVLFKGNALPHFNEVDECAGLDALITNRVWRSLKQPPENTLHDLRWGEHYKGRGIDDYVWVFLISGGAPPAHYIGGYAGTTSHRQVPCISRMEEARVPVSANRVKLYGAEFTSRMTVFTWTSVAAKS